MPPVIDINTRMINWAISRAGYDLPEFYGRFPRVQGWLEQDIKPTLPQLRDFARNVHLPFGYLLLKQPPKEELPIPFFRTKDAETSHISINLRDTILTLQKRQDWLRSYLIEQGAEPQPYVGKFNSQTPVTVITADIRNTLGLADNWAGDQSSWQNALQFLTEKVEDAGIFMVFNSVVDNNTHRPVTVDECRGFVLSDEFAPFLFVNAADSKSAQMFTIAHELAHIWIGKSAGFDLRMMQPSDHITEKFCDAVAAEFLVPEKLFRKQLQINSDFQRLAKVFKVSPVVVARRALDLDAVSRDEFFDFYNDHVRKYALISEKKSDGGDFYATLRRRLNLRFLSVVNRAVKENKLLYKHAYDLTGLRGTTFEKAVNEFRL